MMPLEPTTLLALSSAQTSASGISLVVTEPTTAASSTPINVNFIGPLISPNNCEIGAAILRLPPVRFGISKVTYFAVGCTLYKMYASIEGWKPSNPATP